MTLPALFRSVGIHVPRGVTVDGRVLLGNQLQIARQESSVTDVRPHRFHGGEDPAPSRDDTREAWWVCSPDLKAQDIASMRAAFSDVVVIDDEGLAYGVTFDTGRGKYSTLILPHVDATLPSVIPVQPKRLGRNEGRRFKAAPHLYQTGALCIADTADWSGQNYDTSVAAVWAAHWFACYTTWRMNGNWPSEGYESIAN